MNNVTVSIAYKFTSEYFYRETIIVNNKFLVRETRRARAHTCMSIPLALNPIRVQSCVCCLF